MDLPIRVLLIDSNEQERRLARRLLLDDVPKLVVCEIADACALVEALDEEAPFAVVADCDLEWADGVALLRQIRRKWRECYTVLFAADPGRAVASGAALRCDAVLRKDTAGFNALGEVMLDLIAESRHTVLAAHRFSRADRPPDREAVSADDARPGTRAAAGVPGSDSPAPAVPGEEAGASTLDWFPEMEESDAAAVVPGEDAQGPVHQLLPAVNLESVILTAMSQLKPLIRSTRARVRAGPLPTLRLERTDGLALFRNLIANAIEHAGDAPPVVTIHAERRTDYWLLSVHDNGLGIAGPDVGEALHLIHPPGKAGAELDDGGLATCGQIARRYGGSLWMQPRDGGGTSVYVALCTAEAAGSGDVEVTVQFQGHAMGRISVSSLSNKQQIAGRAMELPSLRTAIKDRGIKDVVFVDADVVKVVA